MTKSFSVGAGDASWSDDAETSAAHRLATHLLPIIYYYSNSWLAREGSNVLVTFTTLKLTEQLAVTFE